MDLSNIWMYLSVAILAPIVAAVPVAILTRKHNPPTVPEPSSPQTPPQPMVQRGRASGKGAVNQIQQTGNNNRAHIGDYHFSTVKTYMQDNRDKDDLSTTSDTDPWTVGIIAVVALLLLGGGFARWTGLVLALSVGLCVAVVVTTALLVAATRSRLSDQHLPRPAKTVISQNVAVVMLTLVVWILVATTTRFGSSIRRANDIAVADGGTFPYNAISDAIGMWGFGLIVTFAIGVVMTIALLISRVPNLVKWASFLRTIDAAKNHNSTKVEKHIDRAAKFSELDWRPSAVGMPIVAVFAILASSGLAIGFVHDQSTSYPVTSVPSSQSPATSTAPIPLG